MHNQAYCFVIKGLQNPNFMQQGNEFTFINVTIGLAGVIVAMVHLFLILQRRTLNEEC